MRMSAMVAGALAVAFASTSVNAASFTVTYEAPHATQTSASFDYKGVETFNGLTTGVQSFDTDFGGSNITATYSNVIVQSADQYGGAEGAVPGSNYAVAGLGVQGSYSIDFTSTGATGVNYFGYWLSALDPGNTVRFFANSVEVFSFDPSNVLDLVAGNQAYFGNPLTGENAGEPYVFLNFFYDGGTFDRIVFEQAAGSGAGYESDNHTIGYFTDKGDGTVVPGVPEPTTWVMLISGFGMVGGAMRLRRREEALAA